MQMDISKVLPGMTLQQTILGKTGKPLIEENTVLTEEHIVFLDKFLINNIDTSPLLDAFMEDIAEREESTPLKDTESKRFIRNYRDAVNEYKLTFRVWRRKKSIQMLDLNRIGSTLFNDLPQQEFKTIIELMNNSSKENVFYEKVIATSVLSIYLAMKTGFDRKECTQIGYAGLLRDSGMIHFDERMMREEDQTIAERQRVQLHPVYSYKLVEPLTMLTQSAKLGILQHHELMDGSGYPGKAKEEKIHAYAQILMISEYFYLNYYQHKNIKKITKQLRDRRGTKYAEFLVDELLANF